MSVILALLVAVLAGAPSVMADPPASDDGGAFSPGFFAPSFQIKTYQPGRCLRYVADPTSPVEIIVKILDVGQDAYRVAYWYRPAVIPPYWWRQGAPPLSFVDAGRWWRLTACPVGRMP